VQWHSLGSSGFQAIIHRESTVSHDNCFKLSARTNTGHRAWQLQNNEDSKYTREQLKTFFIAT